ncbi:nuclear transport factor 2 family protein [Longitalea arenae]|uniref:nuclear transport factor 2 family protein n=1 Tax=Longitalea arenae TaxID=2812558 RepID=UPI001967D7F8|nr:hypothetical protein [Longitalea arenae]
MTQALQTIRDLYVSMEQGNIGKLVIALDEAVYVHTAACMGGNRRGREGILQLVPVFYRPGSGIKKVIDHFIEHDSRIIVVGNICITTQSATTDLMPFADIWTLENNNILTVIFYYRDPQELCNYLEATLTR